MKTVQNRIENIKKQGYEIDFGIIFNHAFEIYKKIAVNAGVAILLFSLVVVFITFGLVAMVMGFSAFTETMADFQPQNLPGIYIAGYILAVALFSGLLSPFTAGILKMAHCAETKQEFSIGTVLDYYKAPYFTELFLAVVIITLFSMGISTLLEVLQVQIIGAFISVIVSFFTIMTIPLIVFGNLKAVEAIQGSFIVVSKKPLIIVALVIVAALATLVGLIAFCIGILFTIPFMYAMYYSIYLHSVGVEEENKPNEINSDWNE